MPATIFLALSKVFLREYILEGNIEKISFQLAAQDNDITCFTRVLLFFVIIFILVAIVVVISLLVVILFVLF